MHLKDTKELTQNTNNEVHRANECRSTAWHAPPQAGTRGSKA